MRTPNFGTTIGKDYFEYTLDDDLRLNVEAQEADRNKGGLNITQIYLQLAKDGFCLYSYPPALNLPSEWSDTIDGYQIGDLSHYEPYRKAFRARKPVINFVNKDLQYASKRVTTIAHPLFEGRYFWGILFYEIDTYKFFQEIVLTRSFEIQKYPFM